MKFCVIDTEGSGLFNFQLPADAPSQPRLAELAMILLKDDLSVEEEYRALVKPDGWEMQPEATAVNGLTTERLEAEGKPIGEVLDVYQQAIREGFAIAAFNAQFDCKTMRGEFRRAGRDDLFTLTKNVCVMRKSQGVIPRPDGKKSWPKLEHCRAFLNLSDAGAHGAVADAHAAVAILRYLHSRGVDLTPEVHYARNRPDNVIASGGTGEFEVEGCPRVTVDLGKRSPALPPLSDAPVSRPRSAALPPRAEDPIPE